MLCLRRARWPARQSTAELHTASVCVDCGDRFGNQLARIPTGSQNHTNIRRRCASIMSRPAATARRGNNDGPVGPTPALIYLQMTCQDADLRRCRLLSTLSTLEECHTTRDVSSWKRNKRKITFGCSTNAANKITHQLPHLTTKYFRCSQEKEALLT